MPAQGKRRALGQHFLKSDKIIATIVDSAVELAKKQSCHSILEIGPGRGAITYPIIEALKKGQIPLIEQVFLAERDQQFILNWQNEIKTMDLSFDVLPGDFVDARPESFLGKLPLMVVSNLPYSAATAIVTKLARFPDKIPSMVLMFQAEVAARLRANCGSKSWGSLSIWIQNRWDVKKLVSVPPGSFSPPPEVDSEVVILEAREEPRISITQHEENHWETLLRVCFAQRRKMLRSGLPKTGPWRNVLEQSQVDGTRRGETLDWPDWQKLWDAYRSIASLKI